MVSRLRVTLSKTIQATSIEQLLPTASGAVLSSLVCSFVPSSTSSETLSCNPTYPSCFDSKPITPMPTETHCLVGILTLVTASDSVGSNVAIAGVTVHAQYIYKLAEMMFFRFFILRQTHIFYFGPTWGMIEVSAACGFLPTLQLAKAPPPTLRPTPIITKRESGTWCAVMAQSISVIPLLQEK